MKTDDKLRDTLQEWLLSKAKYRAGADLIRERFIVIDRADLMGVEDLPFGLVRAYPDAHSFPRGTAERHRANAREFLSLAEYLDAHPPVDEKAVHAIAAMVNKHSLGREPAGTGERIARALIADGWTKP